MRHAYLIMAHNDFYILEVLLKLVDDERNDIYISIDKKAKKFDFDYYSKLVKKSNVFFVKRFDARWGDYSQVKCELTLFKEAYSRHYDYYHFISGIDLPLKSQDVIHNFFEKHKGKEFISFDMHDKVLESSVERILYYHFFTRNIRWRDCFKKKVCNSLHMRLVNLQKKFNIKRKIDFEVRKGASWVSITDDLVGYILSKEKFINKHFKYGLCGDELLIQTLVYNSKFYNNLYQKHDDGVDNMRYILWNRGSSKGSPYTFKVDDFDELMNCGAFFARKFSTSVDKEIIDKIYEKVKGD